jgi:hypothetical protein
VQGDHYRHSLLRDSLVMGITIGAAGIPVMTRRRIIATDRATAESPHSSCEPRIRGGRIPFAGVTRSGNILT